MANLLKIANLADALNKHIGQTVAWLVLLMVLVQFTVVAMRYIYGIGSISMQESLVYMHGILFMVAAGYTLGRDGHVRIDIVYRSRSRRYQALVNLLGSLFFLLPLCIVILYFSTPYVAQSWRVLEGSRETSGIQGVFLLKSVIMVFAILLLVQTVCIVCRSFVACRKGEKPPSAGPDHLPRGQA